MIIDSHLHLLKTEYYNLELFKENQMYLPQDTPLDFLISVMKRLNISKVVVMGQKMERIWDSECGDDYVLESAWKHRDLFLPFVSSEPVDRIGKLNRVELDRLSGLPPDRARGILITPPYGQFRSNDPQVYPFYEIAQDRGWVVQFHHSANTGEKLVFAHHKYASLNFLNDVLIDFPKLRIVIEHLGYPWTEELFTLMASTDNLYADLALLYDQPTLTAWKIVMAKEYGVIHRIMYGSDYYSYDSNAFETMSSHIEYIRSGINRICEKSGWPLLTETEITGILSRNACALYNLDQHGESKA
jgi:predicted TIM-barrel fold metal-dependent hydrolase